MNSTAFDALLWTALLVGFAALPIFGGDYLVGIGLAAAMWLALTQSWSVLSSLTGYVSLGHTVFYGLGSYVVVVTWQQTPLAIALLGAGAASAAFALLVGLPVMRVRGPYFVILTFGLAELVKYSVLALEAEMGVSSRLLFGAPDIRVIYGLMVALAVAATALRILVDVLPFGHGLRSLRENEEAAETVGVPVARYKLFAFVLSAIVPGMVGGVMAMRSTFFEPIQAFDPTISVNIILMAVIGGGESARGPLLGVLFLVILSEWLWAKAPQAYMIILGLLLIVFVLKFPRGLAGWLADWQRARR
ncbi:MAG: branched-chain amino acid ABC transporter permease [Alphaproteobacteria bacterium]|nr:branched-chain amino acid ABC transporter permease [Alphaproteobacteria bacterium]